jgi:hypothetical protein
MKSRAEKIARMVSVQRHMRRLEEWKLIQLQRREDDLHDEERSLIGSLNAEEPLHGLFVEAMARRLSSIGKETAVVGVAKGVQTNTVLAESRKLKHVERMETVATTMDERNGEKRRLENVIGEAAIRAAHDAAESSGRK